MDYIHKINELSLAFDYCQFYVAMGANWTQLQKAYERFLEVEILISGQKPFSFPTNFSTQLLFFSQCYFISWSQIACFEGF